MVFKETKVKVLDVIKFKGKNIAVLIVIENGKLREYRILGICEFEGNPLSSRKPKNEEEKRIIEEFEKKLKELGERVIYYLGKELI